MALFKSQLVTQISGSTGGTTYSRSPSGMYTRARAVPVNPNTAFQVEVRAGLTDLVNRWIDTLTASQREAWNLWAANTPFTNALGDSFNISGQNAYIGANTPRAQAESKIAVSLPRVDNGPTIFDRGDFTTPTFDHPEDGGIDLVINENDAWANENGAALLVYQGRPFNASRTFFKGPWRLIAAILGSSGLPPGPNVQIGNADINANGFPTVQGNNESLAFAVTRADGRYSTRRIVGPQLVSPP